MDDLSFPPVIPGFRADSGMVSADSTDWTETADGGLFSDWAQVVPIPKPLPAVTAGGGRQFNQPSFVTTELV